MARPSLFIEKVRPSDGRQQMRWNGGSPSETPQYAAFRGVTKSDTAAAYPPPTKDETATRPMQKTRSLRDSI